MLTPWPGDRSKVTTYHDTTAHDHQHPRSLSQSRQHALFEHAQHRVRRVTETWGNGSERQPEVAGFPKTTLRTSLTWVDNDYEFLLPAHKADTTFEGNRVHIAHIINAPDPHPIMARYTCSRDRLFPLHPQLWLRSNGTMPTRAWFLACLSDFCPPKIAGQSMRAGGATALVEGGASGELIRGAGRWSSNAFKRYIRKNVIVLHALILGRSLHYSHEP